MQASGKGNQGWRVLASASPDLRADRGVVAEAIRLSNGCALEAAAPELQYDGELLCEALRLQATSSLWSDGAVFNARPSWESIIERFMPKDGSARSARRVRRTLCKQGSRLADEETNSRGPGYRRESAAGDIGGVMREDEGGQQIRVVPVVGIRLRRSDGFILAQMAKADPTGSKLVSECLLPGRSIYPDRWPRDEAIHFIEDMLTPLARAITLHREVTFMMEERTSRTKHVQTRYLRAVFDATLEAGYHWERFFEEVPLAAETLRRRGVAYRRRSPPHGSGLVQRMNAGNGNSHLAPDMYTISAEHLDRPSARALIYAWLPQWEYDWLHEPVGKATADGWVADLDPARVGTLVKKLAPKRPRTAPLDGLVAALRELRLEPRPKPCSRGAEDRGLPQSARPAEDSEEAVRRAVGRFKALREEAVQRRDSA